MDTSPPETDIGSLEAKAARQRTSQRGTSTYETTSKSYQEMNSTRAVSSLGQLEEAKETASSQQPSRSLSKQNRGSTASTVASESIGETSTGADPWEYIQDRGSPTSCVSEKLQWRESDPAVSYSDYSTRNSRVLAVTQQPSYSLRSRVHEDANNSAANARDTDVHIKTLENALARQQQEKIYTERALVGAREELQRTFEELEEIRKKWKKAASQLSQLRSDGARSCQLIDSDLIDKVKHLRYEIQSFSLQYFEAQGCEEANAMESNQLLKHLRNTTPLTHDYKVYLESGIEGPMVIQSFLWRMLVGEVFGKFHWLPLLGREMTVLYEALKPGK